MNIEAIRATADVLAIYPTLEPALGIFFFLYSVKGTSSIIVTELQPATSSMGAIPAQRHMRAIRCSQRNTINRGMYAFSVFICILTNIFRIHNS